MIHPDEYDTVVLVDADTVAAAVLYSMETDDRFRAHGQMAILMDAKTNRTAAAFTIVDLKTVEAHLDRKGLHWSLTDNIDGKLQYGLEIIKGDRRLTIKALPNPSKKLQGIESILIDSEEIEAIVEQNFAENGQTPDWELIRRWSTAMGGRYITERFMENIDLEFEV